MANPKNIQDELKEMNSSLHLINGRPVMEVPEGYFDGLAASILSKIKGREETAEDEIKEISPILAGISKQMPFSIPVNYFEASIENLSQIIKEDSVPAIPALSNKMPFTVPAGYFDNLAGEVMQKINKPTALVVPLFARTWMRLAVAAVITGILFTAGLQFLPAENTNPVARQKPDSTSQQLVAENQNVTQEIKKASTEELVQFIEEVQANVPVVEKTKPAPERAVKELLKDVSAAEMETFLSALPADEEFTVTD